MTKVYPETSKTGLNYFKSVRRESTQTTELRNKLELLGKKLDSTDEIEIIEKGSALTQKSFFQDGKRKVDFVLIYQTPKVGEESDDVIKYRREFLSILNQKGIEHEDVKSGQVHFVKLHATTEFLFEQAELLHLKFPFCDRWQEQINKYVEDTKTTLERKAREDQDIRAKDLRLSRIGKDFNQS